jgi:uncharacterized membrane protein
VTDTMTPLEHILARVLRAGTFVSGAMLASGLLLTFVWPALPTTRFLLEGGALVLLLTPVVRVLVSFGDYLWTRDWWFALWTGLVLALLASGFMAAFHR